MRLRPAVRMQIGLSLVVVFALVSDLRMVTRAVHALSGIRGPDEITRHEVRFHELKQALPLQARVGYVTDPMVQQSADAGRLAFKRYVLTQYTLLPAIVSPDIRGPLVVGNFYSSSGLDSAAPRGLRMIRDFGGGVLLFGTAAE